MVKFLSHKMRGPEFILQKSWFFHSLNFYVCHFASALSLISIHSITPKAVHAGKCLSYKVKCIWPIENNQSQSQKLNHLLDYHWLPVHRQASVHSHNNIIDSNHIDPALESNPITGDRTSLAGNKCQNKLFLNPEYFNNTQCMLRCANCRVFHYSWN